MIIETYVLVANRALQNPLRCFVFRDIWILKLNSLKNRENGHNMHQNGHIWYFLAIFVVGSLFALSERYLCQTDALISPIWKNGEGFSAQKSPKIEKMAILTVMLAILGHFLRFSPDDHLDTCFSDQQDFTESTLVLYILRH